MSFSPEQDRYGCFLSYFPDGLVDFIESETAGLVVQHGCYLIVWSRAKLTR